jgi:nicotinamide mononucleotide transporter
MSVVEVAAVVLGFLSVWLTVRQDWRCWPVGLVSVLAFAVLFWRARLYGAATLQLIYAGTQLYGWWAWRHGGEGGDPLVVGRTPRRLLFALLGVGAAATAVLATALGRFTDAALPLTDAATTSFSLVAQVLLTRKWIENWLLWIAVDAVYVVMYLSQSLHLTAALYIAFLVLAVLGWKGWKKETFSRPGPDGPGGEGIRVVVIGPECIGKTTLARDLAGHFDVPWVPEFARAFAERVRRPVRFDDVDAIGRGQRAAEDRARRRGLALLVLDTDLVSTCVYSRHYYGSCPSWIEEEARARLADLYLLLATDVPWVPEGYLREQPERRDELYGSFKRTLEQWGARVVEVRGPWADRRAAAIAAIEARLAAPRS